MTFSDAFSLGFAFTLGVWTATALAAVVAATTFVIFDTHTNKGV